MNNKIFLFLLLLSELYYIRNDWSSPCERMKNPSAVEDCTGKSTEFIDEICCYLEGKEYGEDSPKTECVDIIIDDTVNEHRLNETKKKIINGAYWEVYKNPYDYINTLRCYSTYLVPGIISCLFILF